MIVSKKIYLIAFVIALPGCPAVSGALESIEYPKDIHQKQWTPPDVACKENSRQCLSPAYVGECLVMEPSVIWETLKFSAQQYHPLPVKNLAATCVESSCTATVQGGSVIVQGKAPVVSHVKIAYDHPVTQEHFDVVVELPFGEEPTYDALHPKPANRKNTCSVGTEGADSAQPSKGLPGK
jgi:hypothetical protein